MLSDVSGVDTIEIKNKLNTEAVQGGLHPGGGGRSLEIKASLGHRKIRTGEMVHH